MFKLFNKKVKSTPSSLEAQKQDVTTDDGAANATTTENVASVQPSTQTQQQVGQPQTPTQNTQVPGYEEYVYQPKPKGSFKKASKVLLAILSFILILIPIAYVFVKGNPFASKNAPKKGEITWWALGMDENVLKKMIADYQTKNPKAKINLIVQSPVDYRVRLVNSLKDKNGPDVFTIHNSWVPMMIDYLDPIPESVYTKQDYTKDFYPVTVRDMNTSDGLVGIPLEYDALTLFINEKIFSSSGQVPPQTWDELEPLATKLTLKSTNGLILQSGLAMGLSDNVEYWPEILGLLMMQNKANLYSPVATANLSSGALSEFGNFRSVERVWNETLPQSTVAFAEGKVAMIFAPASAANAIRKLNPDLKFKTVIVPQVRRDDPNEPEYSYATYWVQSVWNKSGDKELAWDFLKFLSSEDSLQKMNDEYASLGLTPKVYPRIAMRDKQINDRVLGSVVALAPVANSWYLADKTNDGDGGINSVVNADYKKTIDQVSLRKGGDLTPFLKTLTAQLRKDLTIYNVTK